MKYLFIVLTVFVFISGYLWAQSNQDCGLVAYYPFNGNANDESGNGKNGEVHGANLTEDRFGNTFSAYLFDGINDYIVVPHSFFINFDGSVDNYSFCVWVKSDTTPASRILEKEEGSSTHNGFPVGISATSQNARAAIYDGSQMPYVDFGDVVDGQWHFLVFVVNIQNDELYAYADGFLVDSTQNTVSSIGTANNAPFYIGNVLGLTLPFGGIIDDIRVYSRALTLQEIDSLFHENGWTAIDDVGLIVPEKFDLRQNYPNPFNPTTKLMYTIPKNSFVKLKVYDITGREVLTLVGQYQSAGSYSLDFNADKLSSGVYTYRLQAGRSVATRKMILVR